MEIVIAVLGLLSGTVIVAIAFIVILLLLPFFKGALLNNPNRPSKISVFTSTEQGKTSIVMREGRVEHYVHGKDEETKRLPDDPKETFSHPLLKAYDNYAFLFGLRFIGIPTVHEIRSYDLVRYRKFEENGKIVYKAVTEGDPSRRSDHYRTQLNPWYNEFTSVDIEAIPFDVKCATNYSLIKEKISALAFGVESWNTLLDQALYSVVRGTIREKVSLDMALGAVSDNIFQTADGTTIVTGPSPQELILTRLLEYKLKDGRTLEACGIRILGFEILDFSPESLTEAELVRLRSPALARREAQGRVLAGKAEAEYQKGMLEVLAKHPELAKSNVEAEALVKMAQSGSLDALAAALLKKLMK